ncbi:MXAN_6627.5 family MYXO-CTERM protein [Pyxidicoccus sp. 3LG]
MSSTRHPFRSHVLGLLACLPLVLPAVALAQSDGGILTPDASVGEGGPGRDNEEGEGGVGRVNEVCRSTRDCSPRFTCQEGHCRYVGVRQAEQHGCLLGPEAALVMVGLAALGARRKK